jgi:hypothetical protein
MKGMLDNFLQILPEVIFDAAETLGGHCTGRFYALNAKTVSTTSRWKKARTSSSNFTAPAAGAAQRFRLSTIFLNALKASEIPVVCPLTDDRGQSIFEITEVLFTIFPKRPGRLEPELTTEQLTRLGRFMARLHNVGATKPPLRASSVLTMNAFHRLTPLSKIFRPPIRIGEIRCDYSQIFVLRRTDDVLGWVVVPS